MIILTKLIAMEVFKYNDRLRFGNTWFYNTQIEAGGNYLIEVSGRNDVYDILEFEEYVNMTAEQMINWGIAV